MHLRILFVIYILAIGCGGTETRIQQLKKLNDLQLDSIRKRVLTSYKDTVKFDTAFVSDKGNTVFVKLRHLCTYDNKVNTPREYLDVYKLTKFQTHNFVTRVEFRINSKTIYDGFITKDDFKANISNDLKRYGVLKLNRPDIDISGDKLSIEYRIVIPLAGVDLGYIIEIDSAGIKHTGSLD